MTWFGVKLFKKSWYAVKETNQPNICRMGNQTKSTKRYIDIKIIAHTVCIISTLEEK